MLLTAGKENCDGLHSMLLLAHKESGISLKGTGPCPASVSETMGLCWSVMRSVQTLIRSACYRLQDEGTHATLSQL